MGEVLLGMPGQWAKDCSEESDHCTTKIGGLPDWPIPDMSIEPDVLICGVCGRRLCLVAQVYAPISSPKLNIEERVIYIFGCLMPKCGSNPRSWRAIRVQKCHVEKQIYSSNKEVMTLEKDSEPCSKSNKWFEDDLFSFGEQDHMSDDEVDLEELGRAFSEVGALSSQPRKENISDHSKDARNDLVHKPRSVGFHANKTVLPCFYIHTQKMQSCNDVSAVCDGYSSLTIKGGESPPEDPEDEERWEEENYEYDKALGADRTYLKFKKQLDLYPDQCFRYAYGGKPLLPTPDLMEPESCRICGSPRLYEMQLMSPLLYFLHQAADGSSTRIPDEWSWLTLILYTCSSSCCPKLCKDGESISCSWAIADEAIFVQDE